MLVYSPCVRPVPGLVFIPEATSEAAVNGLPYQLRADIEGLNRLTANPELADFFSFNPKHIRLSVFYGIIELIRKHLIIGD